jgi:hypothetical protein
MGSPVGSDLGLGGLDQVLQPAFWCVGSSPALAGSNGHPEFRCLASHIRPFGHARVTSIRDDGRMHQACILPVGGSEMNSKNLPVDWVNIFEN